MRQIPYTMMKFACFERTVELLYKYVVPKPRSECSKSEQLVVTFVAGYIGEYQRTVWPRLSIKFWFRPTFVTRLLFLSDAAGVFCAVVSHPADSVVSVLNKEKGSTAVQVLKRLGPKGPYECI